MNIIELKPCPLCGSKVAISVLEDEPGEIISAWVACSCGVEIHERRTEGEAAMQWNCRAGPDSETARENVTDKMVTAAMRAFERMSSVLRYREKDKWHSCDIMGMRDAIKAALNER